MKTCERCGVMFGGYAAQRFCSRTCWLKTFNTRGAAHSLKGAKAGGAWNKKRRGTGKGKYIKRDGRHEHRIIAEEMLGRPLRHGEVVHHREDDVWPASNDPSNLQVCASQSEHMRLEQAKRRQASL